MSTTDKTITSILEIKNNPKILDSGFDRVYTVISDKTTNETVSTYISELDSSIGLFDFSNIFDIKKFRPEYDYATLKLSSYKDKEDDINKLGVIYELIVSANNNYYVIDKINSENGDAEFKNLAIGQKYYIRASDLNNEYKSQMSEFIPTEKDQDMQIQLLTTYNLASNSGFSYHFLLKNVIDENPYLYIEDQPKLNMVKNHNGGYTITGLPIDRFIKLNVEHEKGFLVQTDSLTLTINGEMSPVQTIHNAIYEAPYRILKEFIPDIDSELSSNPSYTRLIPQSGFINFRNVGGVLYYKSENVSSYTKDINYNHTSTFRLQTNIDRLVDSFTIKDLNGEIAVGDMLISNDERMKVVSFNITTNTLNVIRGVDGTIPYENVADGIIFVEELNISNFVIDDTPTNINLVSRTFSTEIPVDEDDDFTFISTGLAASPYPPINVKFNDVYWLDEVIDTLTITWGNNNKNDHFSFYEEGGSISLYSYKIELYNDEDDLLSINEVFTNTHNLDLSLFTGNYCKVIIYTRLNNMESSYKVTHRLKIFRAPRDIQNAWDDPSERMNLSWILD